MEDGKLIRNIPPKVLEVVKMLLAQARYVVAAIAVVVSVGFVRMALSNTDQKIVYGHELIVTDSLLDTPGWPDLNYDGIVNFKDLAILARAWRSTTGDPTWDANCDISSTLGDGVID